MQRNYYRLRKIVILSSLCLSLMSVGCSSDSKKSSDNMTLERPPSPEYVFNF